MKDISSARWNEINACALGTLDQDAVRPPFSEEELRLVESGKKQVGNIKRMMGGKSFTFGISADVDFDNPLYDSIYSDDFKKKRVDDRSINKHNIHHGPDGRFTNCDGSCGSGGSTGSGSMKNNHGETLSAGQSAYFAKSQVVDENGNLIEVYHGTVHEFTAFDTDMANPENDMGQGIYFSDNDYDVDANYASEDGPDLQAKMDRYQEMLENEGMDPDEAEAKARETFITAEPNTLNCYLNMENPVRLGGDKETFFDFNQDYDPDTGELYGETGKLIDFYNEVENLAYDGKYDVYDPERFLQSVGENLFGEAFDWGGMSAEEAIKAVKEASFDYVNIENQYGDYVTGGNELAREALENMGYDGIIDKTVGQKFRGMTNMTSDTTHYIIFDSNQAKLVDNQNPTSDPNINKSKEGRKMSGYNIYKLNKAEQAIVNALTKKCWDGEKRDFSRLDAADRNILTGLLEKAGQR